MRGECKRRVTDTPDQKSAIKPAGAKSSESKALTQDMIAHQAALHDAAALLAQNATVPSLANPVYANLLTTNLAQQQLATAQVLANLRASVGGFKPMKSEHLTLYKK